MIYLKIKGVIPISQTIKYNLHNESGFTLVEIIASLAILSLAIVMIVPMFVDAADWANRSEEKTVANHLLPRVAVGAKAHADDILDVWRTADGTVTSMDVAEILPYDQPVTLDITESAELDHYEAHVRIYPAAATEDLENTGVTERRVLAESYIVLRGEE